MRVLINQISNDLEKKWNNLLRSHPNNTVFQSPDMFYFYEKVQNFEPFLFLFEDDTSKCKGVLLAVRIKEGRFIKGYLSSRIVVYGGPIIDENDKNRLEILDALIKSLVAKLGHSSIFIQFRNFFNWNESEKQIFLDNRFTYRDRLNLIVDTHDKEIAIGGISKTKLRQIHSSIKSGAGIVAPKNIKEVRILYNMLFSLYKNKVKKPLPPWSFFKEFYNLSQQGRLGIIRLIKLNDNIIGGIVCPITVDKNIYEWYVIGLDEEYKKNYPSVLATWAPIDYAIKNNLLYFDFMGLGKPQDKYGVRDFKLRFGNNLVNYGRFGRRNKILYPIVQFAYNILREINRI